jgi:hypothetical protein
MVAGISSNSSRHTAAKLYGTQRMTHPELAQWDRPKVASTKKIRRDASG